MDKLIKKFEESSFLMKALLIVPIIFLALFYGFPMIFDQESKKRKKVDDKDAKLGKEIDRAERESAAHEGAISQLEKEKSEQLANLDKEDPAAFHNRRPKK